MYHRVYSGNGKGQNLEGQGILCIKKIKFCEMLNCSVLKMNSA